MINIKYNYTKTEHDYIYKHNTNNTYLVRLMVKDKIYNKRKAIIKSNFQTIKQAKDYIAEERLKFENKENKNIDNLTFRDAFYEYITDCKLEVKKKNLSDSTIDSKQTLFKNQILPKLGNVILTNITEEHIRKFHMDLSNMKNMRNKDVYISNGTIRKIHKQLSAFLNHCVRKGYIRYNPASVVGNFKKEKKEQPYLTMDEFNSLLTQIDNVRDYFIICLLFSTGLRIGEMLGLTLDNIITDKNGKTSLKIDKTYYKGKIRKRAKTDESMDDLYIDETTMYFYYQYLEYREKNNINSKYLFPNTRNIGNCEVLSDKAIRNMLNKYLIRAGITKHITPHKLRHSQAALLIYLGKDLEVVKTKLRHKSIRTTSDEYGHMYKEKKILLADNLSEYFDKNMLKKDFCDTFCDTQAQIIKK